MDWTAETNLLKRIVALLFALASLADRAAAMPRPVRGAALGILRQAEILARTSILASARDVGAPAPPRAAGGVSPPDGEDSGHDPADAALLAARLRSLAMVWTGLLAWFERIARRRTSRGLDLQRLALDRALASANPHPVPALARPYIDTS